MDEELQNISTRLNKTTIIVIVTVIVILLVVLVFLVKGDSKPNIFKPKKEVRDAVPSILLTPEREESLQKRIEQNPQVSLTAERQKALQERIKQMEQ